MTFQHAEMFTGNLRFVGTAHPVTASGRVKLNIEQRIGRREGEVEGLVRLEPHLPVCVGTRSRPMVGSRTGTEEDRIWWQCIELFRGRVRSWLRKTKRASFTKVVH